MSGRFTRRFFVCTLDTWMHVYKTLGTNGRFGLYTSLSVLSSLLSKDPCATYSYIGRRKTRSPDAPNTAPSPNSPKGINIIRIPNSIIEAMVQS